MQVARKPENQQVSMQGIRPIDRLEEIYASIRAIGEQALEYISPSKIQDKVADLLSPRHKSLIFNCVPWMP